MTQIKAENPDEVDPQEETHAPEGGEDEQKTEEEIAKEKADADAKKLDTIIALMGQNR